MDDQPAARPTNQISAIRESIVALTGQQRAIMDSQDNLNRKSGEILDILKGTLQTPGVLQRLSDVERGLNGVQTDLCAHVGEHKAGEIERAKQSLEDARDKKKRTWDRQDALTIALLLMALTPFVNMVLKVLGFTP